MKAIDILCASQASTSIVDYMDSNSIHQPPPPSSSSSAAAGGRAIDRHNPIIQDEKRQFTRTQPTTTTTTTNKIKSKKSTPRNSIDQKRKPINVFGDENNKDEQELIINKNSHVRKQGALLGWGCTRPGDFISPATSSRFLLADKAAFSDQFDPLLKQVPAPPPPPEKPDKFENEDSVKKKDDVIRLSISSSSPPKVTPRSSSSLSSRSSDQQVVVLRVSLHCKGCEKKMRKHLSKMEGVKDFKIDFMAKMVTVIGDITPLAVLTSISKVKNAKLLTPTTISSADVPSVDSDFSEIKKQLEIVL